MIEPKKIDHINLIVSSLDRIKDYFERVFGFKIVPRDAQITVNGGPLKPGENQVALPITTKEHIYVISKDGFRSRKGTFRAVKDHTIAIELEAVLPLPATADKKSKIQKKRSAQPSPKPLKPPKDRPLDIATSPYFPE